MAEGQRTDACEKDDRLILNEGNRKEIWKMILLKNKESCTRIYLTDDVNGKYNGDKELGKINK